MSQPLTEVVDAISYPAIIFQTTMWSWVFFEVPGRLLGWAAACLAIINAVALIAKLNRGRTIESVVAEREAPSLFEKFMESHR